MAISFAGVDLLLDSPAGDVGKFLDRYLSLDGLRLFGAHPIAYERSAGILPVPNYPPPPPPRLNTLYWPTGATRWAMGLFLADDDAKDAILEAVGGPRGTQNLPAQLILSTLPGDQTPDADSFLIDSQTNTVGLSTEMYLLPPRPISADDSGDTKRLWLLPLVDHRYYWQYLYVDEITDDPLAWSDIITAIGLTDSNETPNSSYGDPPDHLAADFSFENAAYALDALAHMIGQRVVRRIDGTVKMQTADTADTDHSANTGSQSGSWFLAAGGDLTAQHPAAVTPERVTVVFRATDNDEPNNLKEYTVSGITKVTADTRHTIYSGRVDDFSSGSPTSENDSAAQQLATDYYAWLGKRHDYCFVGVKKWEATGFDDAIEWTLARLHGGEYLANTRVQSLPYNFAAVESAASVLQIKEGILASHITPSTGDGANETTANLKVYKGSGADWADTGDQVPVTNRDDHFAASMGDHIVAVRVNGEWRPIPSDTALVVTLQGRIIRGETASATLPGGGTITVSADYASGYYFSTSGVIARYISGTWQIISPGAAVVTGTLAGDLVSGGTATVNLVDGNTLTLVPPWSTTLSSTIAAGTKVTCVDLGPGYNWAVLTEAC